LKYKELKSLLDARAREINELHMQIIELKSLLTQKPLIGVPEFHHKEEKTF